ncbi:hypothetical protein Zmor_024914 [Zophobas morio]|uniref:Uncharacterized protein n=1 Tax=Zophobas morio TaxID=2755281 RepID=A0AA38HQN1_9CUCU|nr:hypothetical protein Zmor_024914 [Zophobas morio]
MRLLVHYETFTLARVADSPVALEASSLLNETSRRPPTCALENLVRPVIISLSAPSPVPQSQREEMASNTLTPQHRSKSGTVSCIPLQLHFSAHAFFPRRLRRWGSTGSWVIRRFACQVVRVCANCGGRKSATRTRFLIEVL